MDRYDELQLLCAAHELGFDLKVGSNGAMGDNLPPLWVVVDRTETFDAGIVCRCFDREGCLSWLSERVFKKSVG